MNSLRAVASKSRQLAPVLQHQQKRTFAQGWNHVIGTPPQVRWPFWEKMFMGGCFVTINLSYPLYIVYMMPKWDVRDGNI